MKLYFLLTKFFGFALIAFLCIFSFISLADEYSSKGNSRLHFLKLVQKQPNELNPTFIKEVKGDLSIERGSFYATATEIVPTLIIKQTTDSGKLPVVILMHGTGDRKELIADFMKFFANQGYLTVSIDARYHGERIPGGAHKNQEYNAAILRAWSSDTTNQEHPLVYDTVWDTTRLIDYLITRNDVDPKRIGIIGFSMGGMESLLAATVDIRIKVVIAAISLQSYRWSLDNNKWQPRADLYKKLVDKAAADMGQPYVNADVLAKAMTKLMPGILDEFDGPSIVQLLAPRPLLILNGKNDLLCPLESTMVVFKVAEVAYREKEASDNLMFNVSDSGHNVTESQLEIAKEWLKNKL